MGRRIKMPVATPRSPSDEFLKRTCDAWRASLESSVKPASPVQWVVGLTTLSRSRYMVLETPEGTQYFDLDVVPMHRMLEALWRATPPPFRPDEIFLPNVDAAEQLEGRLEAELILPRLAA